MLTRRLTVLGAAALLAACSAPQLASVAGRLPGPAGTIAGAAATAGAMKSTADAASFVRDRSPVPMRGTYRVTHSVGDDQTVYYLRTAPMSGMPIMGPGRMGQSTIQGYAVMAATASTPGGFDQYDRLRTLEKTAAEAEARRHGLGAGVLWMKGTADKSVTSGRWQAIVSINFPEGANPFFDRHRQVLTRYELGQEQGGEEMFEKMEAGELTVSPEGARFTQTIRDPQGRVLFTIAGERISQQAIDYGDEQAAGR